MLVVRTPLGALTQLRLPVSLKHLLTEAIN